MCGFLPETVVGSFCCASESFETFVNATYIQVLLLDFCFMLLMGHPGIPCSEMRKKSKAFLSGPRIWLRLVTFSAELLP